MRAPFVQAIRQAKAKDEQKLIVFSKGGREHENGINYHRDQSVLMVTVMPQNFTKL